MRLLIYGNNTVREALLSGNIKKGGRIYVSGKNGNGIQDEKIKRLCENLNVSIETRSEAVFIKDYGKEAFAKGIAAVIEYREKVYEDLFERNESMPEPAVGRKPFFLILDEVTDPQNLGSIIRTASCTGISGIIVPKSNSAFITSSAAYVSQGGLFYVDVVRVPNIARAIEDMKKRGIWVSGLSAQASETIYDMDFNVPAAIAVGSEGKGLRRLTSEKCDRLLKIPMSGNITSLNASVSFAIAVYEAVRQRNFA